MNCTCGSAKVGSPKHSEWCDSLKKAEDPFAALAYLTDEEIRAVAERVGRRPVLKKLPPKAVRARAWQFPIVIIGKKGETRKETIQIGCKFRTEKLWAVDYADGSGKNDPLNGHRTIVEAMWFGAREFRVDRPTHSFMGSLGSGVAYPTVKHGSSIGIRVRFLEDAHWFGALLGKAIC